MNASVILDLPGWTKKGTDDEKLLLKSKCKELNLNLHDNSSAVQSRKYKINTITLSESCNYIYYNNSTFNVIFLYLFISANVHEISNKYSLGYTEVEIIQNLIDGVNVLWEGKASKTISQKFKFW